MTREAGKHIVGPRRGHLRDRIVEAAARTSLELLLRGMGLAFRLSRTYRKNIQTFEGQYLFTTTDGAIAITASFKQGRMKVCAKASDDWDVRITFRDAGTVIGFIFSKDQDILDSILKNRIQVDGNLNYIYKFGFMATDLPHRLGVA